MALLVAALILWAVSFATSVGFGVYAFTTLRQLERELSLSRELIEVNRDQALRLRIWKEQHATECQKEDLQRRPETGE